MPELKPLPCPAWACQSILIELEQDGESFFIECKECGMRGPVEPDPYHAQQSWDWIPRALTWGNEPPKQVGLHLLRPVLTALGVGQYGPIQIIDVTQDMIGAFHERPDFQWAGPITPPRE